MIRGARHLAIALAALVGGAIGASAAGPASASETALEFDLGTIVPGTSATAAQAVALDRDATVATTSWLEDSTSDDVEWSTALCGDSIGCIAMSDLEGTFLRRGTYDLTVSARLPEHVAEDSFSATAGGELTFVEAGSALAVTGGAWPWAAAMMGAVACAIGALLVTRRRTESVR
jgi:hypothetical protein